MKMFHFWMPIVDNNFHYNIGEGGWHMLPLLMHAISEPNSQHLQNSWGAAFTVNQASQSH